MDFHIPILSHSHVVNSHYSHSQQHLSVVPIPTGFQFGYSYPSSTSKHAQENNNVSMQTVRPNSRSTERRFHRNWTSVAMVERWSSGTLHRSQSGGKRGGQLSLHLTVLKQSANGCIWAYIGSLFFKQAVGKSLNTWKFPHVNMGYFYSYFYFRLCFIPTPPSLHSEVGVLFPFPRDSHGIPIFIGNPIPMVISITCVYTPHLSTALWSGRQSFCEFVACVRLFDDRTAQLRAV